jgi:hypothetical protein
MLYSLFCWFRSGQQDDYYFWASFDQFFYTIEDAEAVAKIGSRLKSDCQ